MIKVTNKDNNMPIPTNRQSGVAAIFVVVFFTLLISIIVLSFVQIVTQDQRQATNADLSSSAYDSAQAGVEDAKRGLELYRRSCIQANPPASTCVPKYTDSTTGALSGKDCTIFQDTLGPELGLTADPTTKEVKIVTNSNDNDKNLDQAYTCLKVNLYPTDYKRSLNNGNTILFPLKAVGGISPTSITLNWFDKSQGNPATIPNVISNLQLPTDSLAWGSTKPPIMRVQVIAVPQGAGAINMDMVDQDSRVVFLYPSSNPGAFGTVDIKTYDPARSLSKFSPVAVKCSSDIHLVYACSVKIENFAPSLPPAVYDYYLRLTTIYNGANLQVQILSDSGESLKFDGVQPEIDSTGRTNDVFRRIISRISFDADTSGVDVTQGICKAFQLADSAASYKQNPGECPNED